LSRERAGQDQVFADEMLVSTDDDVLYEADAIGAEGAGFSGGDPLCRLERTVRYLRLLKRERGEGFHIHLYTSETSLDAVTIETLVSAGVDELRFHPQNSDWTGIERTVERGVVTGIEVPALPGQIESLKETALRAESIGVSFLNVNELESSETNFERLAALGMRLTSLDSASIQGSSQTAMELVEWAARDLRRLSVHYCSARFKDGTQMRNRLQRRLERTIRDFEVADEQEPILILGVSRTSHGLVLNDEQLARIHQILHRDFEVPNELMNIDSRRMRIEIAPWILEEIAADLRRLLRPVLDVETGLAREYPSWDRLQTMFEPV
jgi:pyruvate formate-lyase activating enzyme-like uncharacterized protein